MSGRLPRDLDGSATSHRRLGVPLRAAHDRADPPVRRWADRERRRRGRQGSLRHRARLARGACSADLRADRADARADLAGAAALLTRALVFAAILLALALVAIAVIGRQVTPPRSHGWPTDARRRRRRPRTARSSRADRATSSASGVTSSRCASGSSATSRRCAAPRSELEQQAATLERSNAELEQFAYVASHDLQEPLRKVASFCQLLERRYAGQLDERADQYIDFAVDGAKRMQAADQRPARVLARRAHERAATTPVDLGELVPACARANLARGHRGDAAPTSRREPLPDGRGERTLLGALFQNLIGNAIKFRGDDAAATSASSARARRRRAGEFAVRRQRHRHRPGVRRADLRDLPAPARQGRVRRHRDRAGDVPQDRRVPRRADLARARQHGGGATFRFTLPVPDDRHRG